MKIIIHISIPWFLIIWFFYSESLTSISEYIWTHNYQGILVYIFNALLWILKWIFNIQNHSRNNKLFLLFLAVRKVHLKVNAGDCHRWSANELASGRDMTFLAVLLEDFVNVCYVPVLPVNSSEILKLKIFA